MPVETPSVLKQIYDALPPEGQTIFGAIILAGGVFFMVRAWLDGRKKVEPPPVPVSSDKAIPAWLMYGPLHDMMQSVHEVPEQGRAQAEIFRAQLSVLRDIDKTLTRIDNGQEYSHRLWEEMLRDQESLRMVLKQRPERARKTN